MHYLHRGLTVLNLELTQTPEPAVDVWTLWHYNDVIMGTMASKITSLTIGYSTVSPGADPKKISKLRVTGLCAGNSLVTGEFLAQMASNAENVSIWWRHHGNFEEYWEYCHRDPFHLGFFRHNSNPIIFFLSTNFVRSDCHKIYTAHCCDFMTRNIFTTKRNFHRIVIVSENLYRNGPPLYKKCFCFCVQESGRLVDMFSEPSGRVWPRCSGCAKIFRFIYGL